jgi:hypothetical protein
MSNFRITSAIDRLPSSFYPSYFDRKYLLEQKSSDVKNGLQLHIKKVILSGYKKGKSIDQVSQHLDSLTSSIDKKLLKHLGYNEEDFEQSAKRLESLIPRGNLPINQLRKPNIIIRALSHCLDYTNVVLQSIIKIYAPPSRSPKDIHEARNVFYYLMGTFRDIRSFAPTLVAFLTGGILASLIVAAATLLFCSFYYIYSSYFQGCPIAPDGFENYSQMAAQNKFSDSIGREQEIEELAQNLSISKQNSLIISQAGVGKSQLVKSLALRIVKGELPTLNRKKIYYLNLSEVVGSQTLNRETLTFENALVYYLNQFEGFQDQAILVFDELHSGFSNTRSGQQTIFSQMLKTQLQDRGFNFIGLTTTEEYEKYIKPDLAFCQRFAHKLILTLPTDETMIEILRDKALSAKQQYQIDFPEDLLKQIAQERSPLNAHPRFGCQVLEGCIAHFKVFTGGELSKEIAHHRSKIAENKIKIEQQYFQQGNFPQESIMQDATFKKLEESILRDEKKLSLALDQQKIVQKTLQCWQYCIQLKSYLKIQQKERLHQLKRITRVNHHKNLLTQLWLAQNIINTSINELSDAKYEKLEKYQSAPSKAIDQQIIHQAIKQVLGEEESSSSTLKDMPTTLFMPQQKAS